ncbi:K Homology domain, type 1 [Cinara cedri]|uniref:K Homology domain, type 1 n=1 Tax=Cinara cedri TaxID=506608 RepID=A0A5E4MU12_9HEMI|nr:K Homology domain, type 1 [Cinara cedri]
MQKEATNTNKGDVISRISIHNNLNGRIIDKEDNTIKRIMPETETKITISSINYINSIDCERLITVKDSIENISKAEPKISTKLRQSFENDLQSMAPPTVMSPGLHPMAFPGRGSPTSTIPPINSALAADVQETAFASNKNEKPRSSSDTNSAQQASQKLTIIGTAEAQWKSQGMVFDKLRDESFVAATTKYGSNFTGHFLGTQSAQESVQWLQLESILCRLHYNKTTETPQQ